MLYMLRHSERRRGRNYATDTRQPLLVISWGSRNDAEMFTETEMLTLPLPAKCEWVKQGDFTKENE